METKPGRYDYQIRLVPNKVSNNPLSNRNAGGYPPRRTQAGGNERLIILSAPADLGAVIAQDGGAERNIFLIRNSKLKQSIPKTLSYTDIFFLRKRISIVKGEYGISVPVVKGLRFADNLPFKRDARYLKNCP